MRKNKGYQRDTNNGFLKKYNYPVGTNKTLDQYVSDDVKYFDAESLNAKSKDELQEIENKRQRRKQQITYWYVRRIVNKDNQKFIKNGDANSHWNSNKVRVPSLKRSNAVWKRFYELFPYYREHYNELTKKGIKLKKIW